MVDQIIERLRQMVGLNGGDTLLLFSPMGLVVGLLLLGVAGNSQKRRWTARIGWVVLLVSAALLVYALALERSPRAM